MNLIKTQKNFKISFLKTIHLLILTVTFYLPFSRLSLSQEVIQDYSYWAQLCESLTQAQQYEQANAACNNAISFNIKDPRVWGAWAQVLLKIENYPKAMIAYQQQLRLEPESSHVYLGLCETQYYLSQYEAAIATCESALKQDQNWQNTSPQRAWYFRGESFRQLAKSENALFSYDWAIKLTANYSPAFVGRCYLLFKDFNYQEALEACQTARQSAQWDGFTPTQAWQLEGRIYQALQRYPEALNAYNEALARDPQNGEIWRQQAAVLERMGQYSQAVASNTWAIQLMPEDRLTLTQQCTLLNLVTQNQTPPAPEGYTKALASCEQALQKGTGDWNELGAAYAWNQRGNALTGLGRNEEAIVSFQQAIALQPTYGEAWRNISVAFWNLEQYDQALSALDQAIKLNPSDSQAWFNRGRILTEQNQYAQAIMAYDQALLGDINNRSSSAKALLWLNQSAVFWQLQQYQFALEATEKALAVNPDQPTQIKALYNQGLALIGLQNYTEAEEIFKKVLEISPDNDNQAAKDGLKFIQQQTIESANSI